MPEIERDAARVKRVWRARIEKSVRHYDGAMLGFFPVVMPPDTPPPPSLTRTPSAPSPPPPTKRLPTLTLPRQASSEVLVSAPPLESSLITICGSAGHPLSSFKGGSFCLTASFRGPSPRIRYVHSPPQKPPTRLSSSAEVPPPAKTFLFTRWLWQTAWPLALCLLPCTLPMDLLMAPCWIH